MLVQAGITFSDEDLIIRGYELVKVLDDLERGDALIDVAKVLKNADEGERILWLWENFDSLLKDANGLHRAVLSINVLETSLKLKSFDIAKKVTSKARIPIEEVWLEGTWYRDTGDLSWRDKMVKSIGRLQVGEPTVNKAWALVLEGDLRCHNFELAEATLVNFSDQGNRDVMAKKLARAAAEVGQMDIAKRNIYRSQFESDYRLATMKGYIAQGKLDAARKYLFPFTDQGLELLAQGYTRCGKYDLVRTYLFKLSSDLAFLRGLFACADLGLPIPEEELEGYKTSADKLTDKNTCLNILILIAEYTGDFRDVLPQVRALSPSADRDQLVNSLITALVKNGAFEEALGLVKLLPNNNSHWPVLEQIYNGLTTAEMKGGVPVRSQSQLKAHYEQADRGRQQIGGAVAGFTQTYAGRVGAAVAQGRLSATVQKQARQDLANQRYLLQQLDHFPPSVARQYVLNLLAQPQIPDQVRRRCIGYLFVIEDWKAQAAAKARLVDPTVTEREKWIWVEQLVQKGYWDQGLMDLLGAHKNQKMLEVLIWVFVKLNILPEKVLVERLYFSRGQTWKTEASLLLEKKAILEGRTLADLLCLGDDMWEAYYYIFWGQKQYPLREPYTLAKFKQLMKTHRDLKVSSVVMDDFFAKIPKAKTEKRMFLPQRFQETGRIWPDTEPVVVETNNKVDRKATLRRLNEEVLGTELRALLKEGVKIPKPLQTLLDRNDIDCPELFAEIKAFVQLKSDTPASQNNLPVDELVVFFVCCLLASGLLVDGDNRLGLRTAEWQSHLYECLGILLKPVVKAKNVKVRAALVDPQKDIVRGLRFADTVTCCYNARDKAVGEGSHFQERTVKWVPRLGADPLSFIMDLQYEGTDRMNGFVFGRMGYNPATENLVLMINGVYSETKTPALVDGLMRMLGEMAQAVGCGEIVIASQHGGSISCPTGFAAVENLSLESLRALEGGSRFAETEVYDDIGKVANGSFAFRGYRRVLDNE